MEENKIMNVAFSQLTSKEIPQLIEKKLSGREYVNYGLDNKFPNYLFDLYLRSSVLQSVVNGCVDFTMGNKIVVNPELTEDAENYEVNDDGETIHDVLNKIIVDRFIFGGYAVQRIEDKKGNIKLYWLDFQRCRINEDETKLYYSDDWTKWGNKAITYNIYNPSTGKGDVVYYKGNITRGHYPIPPYVASLTSCETQTEIAKYHLNAITNNFNVNAIINFNNGVPEETIQEEIEKLVAKKFNGTDAQTYMLNFNNDKEHATDVVRLNADDFDKKYDALLKSVREDIFISMRATPALFGVNPENNGFSKQEFVESFTLFNKTVVQPVQKQLERMFKQIYGKPVIKFESFNLEDEVEETTEQTVEETTEVKEVNNG